jgi:peptidyl-prolyl cis-trans isomerase C
MPLTRYVFAALAATIACAPALPALAQAPAPAKPVPAAPPPAQAVPPPVAPPPASPAQPPAAAATDPVVATVDGQDIHLSDVQSAMQDLPDQLRGMPPQMLYPMLLDRLIDSRALADEARKQGLADTPEVKRQVERAEDQALQNALLQRDIGPTITEAAIRARYEADYANKPGEPEVHARHILVGTEAQAQAIIAQLQKGADFATLAKAQSTEPGAKDSGGDLGWFKQDEMLPEFAKAAFALQPGQTTQTPVHTQYGWHVIQVLERRQAPPQTLEQAHDEIRQKLIQEGVTKAVTQARAQATIVRFNPDGSPMRATDGAEPPPAPGK